MRLAIPILVLLLAPRPGLAQNRFERATHVGRVDSVWSATLEESRPYLVYTPPSYGAGDDPGGDPQHESDP